MRRSTMHGGLLTEVIASCSDAFGFAFPVPKMRFIALNDGRVEGAR